MLTYSIINISNGSILLPLNISSTKKQKQKQKQKT